MAKQTPKIDQNDGQHKILIDWEEFEKLCAIQATEVEISEWFGCTIELLNQRCKKQYKLTFLDIYKKKSSGGKASLRRQQFQTAMGIKQDGKFLVPPNATMQIWLGKQYLRQADKQEITGKDGTDLFNLDEWRENRRKRLNGVK